MAVKHFTNAFFGEYNKLIDLSKVVLKHWASDFAAENNSDAILFDVSMLFEYYLRKLLKRNGFQLEPKETEPLRIPVGAYMRKLIPDLVIRVREGVGVFDVKYKYYNFKNGVKREDVFQLHTYIGQYGNCRPVRVCGFIYPISEEHWKQNRAGKDAERVVDIFPLRQQNLEIPFCVGFLVIPGSAEVKLSAAEFRQRITPWIDRLLSQLGDVVNSENADVILSE